MKQLDIDVSPHAFVWTPYLTLTLMTFDLDPMIIDLERCDLWPMGHMSKQVFYYLRYDANFPKIAFYNQATLTFDLWPWHSRSTKMRSRHMPLPNLVTVGYILSEIWFFSSIFSSLSQTDRKRCIWAHRACAQVGSKMRFALTLLFHSHSIYIDQT